MKHTDTSWKRKPLEELGQFEAGGTPAKEVMDYWNGDIPFVTAADLVDLYVSNQHARSRLTRKGLDSGKTAVCKPNSVLIATRTRIGRAAIASELMGASQDITAFYCGAQIDPEFLCRYLHFIADHLIDNSRGSTIQGLIRDFVSKLSVPVPPLEEQKRIALRLSHQLAAIDRARAAAEERLNAAKGLAAAYLREVFSSPELQSHPIKTLGDICHIRLGKMLSPVSMTGTRARPYLRNVNVQWGRFDLSDVAEMDILEKEEEKLALKPGDLLVCEGGEPGRAAVWQGQIMPCYYQKALHRLRPIEGNVDPYFIMYRLWLGGLAGEFVNTHAKTTIAHLPAVRLRKLHIQVPPIGVQQKLVKHLESKLKDVGSLTTQVESQHADIANLPNLLLREAFEVCEQ